ncbi:MAG: iron-containing alcohol dehydrogenase [Bacteroidia bacterium]|nr:iron-containing alcohol dehydrogenase [Bacteroidia bacterium]
MEYITIHQPSKIVFGTGSFDQFIRDIRVSGLKRLFVLVVPFLKNQIDQKFNLLADSGIAYHINAGLNTEPGFSHYHHYLEEAKAFQPDGVIGIGGGSVLDVAKLLAAMINNTQKIDEVVGIGLLKKRDLYMACIPTTSGTGSEVSPNAILLDESDGMKKGIISPFLVPDAAYIDPLLTDGMLSEIMASTGMDALTHCLEAFTNKFAHPMIDLYALEGIRLIGRSLVKACANDLQARTDLSLGSLYGGMCLGPVNTAAVHALSYPLGSGFKIAHGLANALLLPYVMEYNLPSDIKRYKQVALALGAELKASDEETAREGVAIVRSLLQQCKLPLKLSEIGIPEESIPAMARSAVKIQRLMKNNIREILLDDAIGIYQKAY